jgi:hypothetical protein
MIRIILAGAVLLGLTTPSLAANVYLKDGGVIKAKSVWRTKGFVHVLVNRDTLVEFLPQEINMKRTFAIHRHVTGKSTAIAAGGAQTATPAETAAPQKSAEKRPGFALPGLPKLPEGKPESITTGGDEGTIRKHKREMLEKANE